MKPKIVEEVKPIVSDNEKKPEVKDKDIVNFLSLLFTMVIFPFGVF